jgi:tRNA (guanine26-N2/guanine27-N2)-dimethyltransferase
MDFSSIPEGWPGNLWLEGKTIVHLQPEQERPSHMPRGPAKKTGGGFLNPAMAPSRTRSVLLLKDALEHDWLTSQDKPIRVFDAMCSTGVRIRRWRNEIPNELQSRLRITGNDLNDFALSWAINSHNQNLPKYTENVEMNFDRYGSMTQRESVNGIFFQKMDAKLAMADASYQWIDIDPFGSPVPFIDSAIQSLARTGVLEVTATDTAALTGSSLSSQKRRYDSQGIVDDYAHDDAVRVLLGLIAKVAAMHDRVIKPILSLFDGHHVRVSVLVKTSKEGASNFQNDIGYRLRCQDLPYKFIKYPDSKQIKNSSGPLWTGPLMDRDIAGRMTVENAIQTCLPSEKELEKLTDGELEWIEKDVEYAAREMVRSVKHIADAADLLSREHLLLSLNAMPRLAGTKGAPKMDDVVNDLIALGHSAARYPDMDPMFITDAEFETVLSVVRKYHL